MVARRTRRKSGWLIDSSLPLPLSSRAASESETERDAVLTHHNETPGYEIQLLMRHKPCWRVS